MRPGEFVARSKTESQLAAYLVILSLSMASLCPEISAPPPNYTMWIPKEDNAQGIYREKSSTQEQKKILLPTTQLPWQQGVSLTWMLYSAFWCTFFVGAQKVSVALW